MPATATAAELPASHTQVGSSFPDFEPVPEAPVIPTRAEQDAAPPDGIRPAVNGVTSLIPPERVLNTLREIANDLSKSGTAIAGCYGASQIFYKLLVGYEHGIRPASALSAIQIIEGFASVNALGIAGAIKARGAGVIEVEELDDTGCTVTVRRADWEPGRIERVTYSVQEAFAAKFLKSDEHGQILRKNGLVDADKKNWRTNHQDMFVARARTKAARRWFPEQILGLPYSSEELEDGEAEGKEKRPVELAASGPSWAQPTAAPATAPVSAPASASGIQASAAATPTAPVAAPAVDASPVPPAAPAVTAPSQEQLVRIKELNESLKVDRSDWAAMCPRFGAPKATQFNSDQATSFIIYLTDIAKLREIRRRLGMTDEQFAVVLKKRNVLKDTDLTPNALKELIARIWDRLTPFDKAALDSWNGVAPLQSPGAPGQGAQNPQTPAGLSGSSGNPSAQAQSAQAA